MSRMTTFQGASEPGVKQCTHRVTAFRIAAEVSLRRCFTIKPSSRWDVHLLHHSVPLRHITSPVDHIQTYWPLMFMTQIYFATVTVLVWIHYTMNAKVCNLPKAVTYLCCNTFSVCIYSMIRTICACHHRSVTHTHLLHFSLVFFNVAK